MRPVLSVFGLDVPSYSLMILLGFLLGFIAAGSRKHLYGLRTDELCAAYVLAGLGSFVGGKTFFVLQGLPAFIAECGWNVEAFFSYVGRAGLVSYGGIIGCLLFVVLAGTLLRAPRWPLLDTLLPALPFAQAFGRIGCFLAGCCYGVPSDTGFYLDPSLGVQTGVRLFPIQLVESAGCAVLFALLMYLGRKKRRPGFLLGVYLLGYGTLRFVVEFWRYDAIRGFWGPMSIAQWFSLGACAAGSWFLFAYPALREEHAQRRQVTASSGDA